jgi:hypothetical protein
MFKSFRTISWLSFICLIGLLPLLFTSDSMNKKKIDIYIFVDHVRYPENIAYDICGFLSISLFIYLILRLVPQKKEKRYVSCFLISSFINTLGYFLFYSQFISLIQIPILITMIIYIYYKHDYEKGNNTWGVT